MRVVSVGRTGHQWVERSAAWWGKAGEQALRRSAYIETVAHCAKAVSLAWIYTEPESANAAPR